LQKWLRQGAAAGGAMRLIVLQMLMLAWFDWQDALLFFSSVADCCRLADCFAEI
jgi:hypothetical protein